MQWNLKCASVSSKGNWAQTTGCFARKTRTDLESGRHLAVSDPKVRPVCEKLWAVCAHTKVCFHMYYVYIFIYLCVCAGFSICECIYIYINVPASAKACVAYASVLPPSVMLTVTKPPTFQLSCMWMNFLHFRIKPRAESSPLGLNKGAVWTHQHTHSLSCAGSGVFFWREARK